MKNNKSLIAFLSLLTASAAFGAWYDRPTVTGRLPVGHDDGGVIQPHYMNMSEDGAYLLVDLASGGNAVKRAAQPALLVRTGDFTLLGEAFATEDFDSGSTGWKGGAISSTLGLMIPGNGGETGAKYTSFNVPAESWTADENAFALTGLAGAGTDGLDFNADGTRLFVNQYASGDRNKILVYDTAALKTEHSLSLLTTRTFSDVNVNRIRNLSCYRIGGKDLVYFGEGENAVGDKSVYVWDPSDDSVTALIDNDAALVDGDVMNVKVSGTTTASPKLYVQFDTGVVRIFTLAADGKSLASQTPVKVFTRQEVNELLGVACASTQYRNLEVSDDGETAYMILRGNNLDLCRIEGTTAPIVVTKEASDFRVTLNGLTATNGLWVAYDATDKGGSTNGWAHVEFVQTVTPATGSVSYPIPDGWGTDFKAVRFFLSEVPYDYDYTLDFLRSGDTATTGYGNKRIVLHDFTFNTKYRVGLEMREVKHNTSGNLALFSTRDTQGSGTPYYTLFWIGGANWRFDYNTVNDNSVAGAKTGEIYTIMADGKNGLWVNGEKLQKSGVTYTYLDKEVTGKLEFFCANQTAGSMSNSNGNMDLFGAQVYASPDAASELLVNLVPMVKNGRAGMYDTVRDKYYYNDTTAGDFKLTAGPSRVEAANPFFASGFYGDVASAGATVFEQTAMAIDSKDYDNPNGGVKKGEAPLKLTGRNDWGGRFEIRGGTLIAGRGQGLGVNDNILLVNVGAAYGGWNGVAINDLGDGPGQISVPEGVYLGYAAVGGDLTVNIGGEATPKTITLTEDFRRFAFNNDMQADGTIDFLNPIECPKQVVIIRNRKGLVRAKGSILGDGSNSNGTTLSVYGDATPQGTFVFAGITNTFKTYQGFGGRYVFGAGTTNVFGGNLNVYDGECIVSNAVLKATGEAGYASGITVTNATFSVIGGEVTASQLSIGNANGNSGAAKVVLAGKVTLDGTINPAAAYGSITISGNAASGALTIGDGADIAVVNCNFYRRNIYVKGGRFNLFGSYGFYNVGQHGTARLTLSGGETAAYAFIQSTNDVPDVSAHVAQCVFDGGTLANRPNGSGNYTRHFFQNFDWNPDNLTTSSGVFASGNGGEFRVNSDTTIDYPIAPYGAAWTTGDYLTVKAFRKSGPACLTLTGTNTYACATDAAEGTLKLADGAALPTTGVVRVTGGTLDLGGNDQKLKAFVATAGAVRNGTITATEGVSFYPGGKGAVGAFTCGVTVAAESGTLTIDVDATGAADSLVTTTELDLSKIDLVIDAATATVPRRLKVVNGPFTGEFKSVSGLPEGWTIHYVDGRVTIGPDRGTAIILR